MNARKTSCELALEEIYKALDRNDDVVRRENISPIAKRVSRESRIMKLVGELGPNYGVRTE